METINIQYKRTSLNTLRYLLCAESCLSATEVLIQIWLQSMKKLVSY